MLRISAIHGVVQTPSTGLRHVPESDARSVGVAMLVRALLMTAKIKARRSRRI